MLMRAHRLLPRLYGIALQLRPAEDRSVSPDACLRESCWKAIYSDLLAKFGDLGRYSEVYDPYQSDEAPVRTSLAVDLADIYEDLKRGCELWDRGFKESAINSWRSLFRLHWSEHATGAIRTLCWLELQHNMAVEAVSSEKSKLKSTLAKKESLKDVNPSQASRS